MRLTLFFTAAILLLLTPGPAVTYIVTRSLTQGRRAGLVSTLGITSGTLLHVAAAAAGLSAILAASAAAFATVKYAGAAYLVWLGIRALRASEPPADAIAPPADTLRRVFWEGALVSVLNPKTAIFFMAFLPQFVDPAREVAPQVALLGAMFAVMALCTDGAYALAAGSAAGWLRGNRRVMAGRRYVAGTVYLGLGVAAAFAGSGRK
jgi:threonine/homoserine/homoserine lactone efflux protein